MTDRGKIEDAINRAVRAVMDWRTVPLADLRDACQYYDLAVLCLIWRMGTLTPTDTQSLFGA